MGEIRIMPNPRYDALEEHCGTATAASGAAHMLAGELGEYELQERFGQVWQSLAALQAEVRLRIRVLPAEERR